MVEKVNFFSWERKPLVSSPNLSFLKVKIHFVNEKVVSLSLRERETTHFRRDFYNVYKRSLRPKGMRLLVKRVILGKIPF
jgi:hypothetical protein